MSWTNLKDQLPPQGVPLFIKAQGEYYVGKLIQGIITLQGTTITGILTAPVFWCLAD